MAKVTRLGWIWGGCIALIFIVQEALQWLDFYTQLSPDHSDLLNLCFMIGVVVGLLTFFLEFFQSSGPMAARLVVSSAFGFLGFLSTYLLSDVLTDIALSHMDFPRGQTRTFKALLPIGRSYRTFARITGYHYTIQPTPLWTNIKITEADYNFMRTHRQSHAAQSDADDIPSAGLFCAKVAMQQAGYALRVVHAGSYKLPEGSIVICPKNTAGEPYVELH